MVKLEPAWRRRQKNRMKNSGNDVRHALKMFRKNPGFTAAAVAALALGIGANTAVFSVVNTVILKPLSYPDSERLVQFQMHSPNGGQMLSSNLCSIPLFHIYQEQTAALQDVAAFDFTSPGFTLTGEHPEQLRGIHVSEAYFRLFGARPILGRTFLPAEDTPNGGKNVVISYGLWQRRFAGDASIGGKKLLLGNESYTIVGVIGSDFRPDPEADIWLPFQFPTASNNQNMFFQAAARLKPEVSLAAANAQMKLAAAEFYRQFPIPAGATPSIISLLPLRDSIVGDARRSLGVMLGAVSLVLLIACANVANLLLARATGRRRELAIRSALGASRMRIVRQLLTESALLACAGGAVGIALGYAGMRGLLSISPAGLPRLGEGGSAVGLDWRVLCFTLAISLATAIVFGLVPAFVASRSDVSTALKESANRTGTGFRQGKVRALLVISETALAVVLLVGAGLLIKTLIALRGVGPGFDARNVLTAEMSMTGAKLHTAAGVADLSRRGRERINSLPGVVVSGSTTWLPIKVDDGLPFQIVGEESKGVMGSRWMSFSPGYLDAFRIPVLRGREFVETDTKANPGVALINESFAKQFFPDKDPIGQHLLVGVGMGPDTVEPPRTIIGIVGDSHNTGLGHPVDAMMMVPTAQVTDAYTAAYSDTSALIWAVKTRDDPHALIGAVSEQLRIASGGFPIGHVRTMEEVMGNSTARENFNMLLLTIFGFAALVLAAIGIYALMAYSVALRTQEMGIRMALGADRATIRRLVAWQGMRLAGAGLVLGVGAALWLSRLMESLLFGVKPWDPAAFVAAPLLLAGVAVMAVLIPAMRAARVDPIEALRVE